MPSLHPAWNSNSWPWDEELDAPPTESAKCPGSSIFNIWRILHTVCHRGHTNLYSYQQCTKVPLSVHSHQHLLSLAFFMIRILTAVRQYLIMILICTFLVLVTWSPFMYLHAIVCLWENLWENVYLSSLPIFKLDYLWVLLLSDMSSLNILDINSLSDIWFANIFSCSVHSHLILLVISFAVRCFWVSCSSTCLFSFYCLCFWCHIQKMLSRPILRGFSCWFSSRVLQIHVQHLSMLS